MGTQYTTHKETKHMFKLINKKLIDIYAKKFPYLDLCLIPQFRIESLQWKVENICFFNACRAHHWLETVKRMQNKMFYLLSE